MKKQTNQSIQNVLAQFIITELAVEFHMDLVTESSERLSVIYVLVTPPAYEERPFLFFGKSPDRWYN